MGWVSHLEYSWNEPSLARFLARLSAHARLILFDKRGTGLSDPVPASELPSLDTRLDDVRDVLPSFRVPTLVVHRTGDRCLRVEERRTSRRASRVRPSSNYPALITCRVPP